MVSFRLSAEEYNRFRELCFSQGIRSLSEMARAAIKLMLEHPARASQEVLESRVSELEHRLQILSLELKRLNQNAASSSTAAAPLHLATAGQTS